MNTWLITLAIVGVMIVAVIVGVSALSDKSGTKQIECKSCGNICTEEANCGLASCGAVSGKTCNCGK